MLWGVFIIFCSYSLLNIYLPIFCKPFLKSLSFISIYIFAVSFNCYVAPWQLCLYTVSYEQERRRRRRLREERRRYEALALLQNEGALAHNPYIPRSLVFVLFAFCCGYVFCFFLRLCYLLFSGVQLYRLCQSLSILLYKFRYFIQYKCNIAICYTPIKYINLDILYSISAIKPFVIPHKLYIFRYFIS